jgi:steroid delta-isomerase-like uncharacterized protein
VSIASNKELVRHAAAIFSRERLEEYLQFYAPDAALHFLPPGLPRGREGARQYYEMFLGAFPDGRVTIDDLIGEGDQVACRFRVGGTHEGSFMGAPATGRRVSTTGITIFRISGGQCVERWSEANFVALLQQVGALAAQP